MNGIYHGLTRLDRFTKACIDGEALNDNHAQSLIPAFFGRLHPAHKLIWGGDNQDLIGIFADLLHEPSPEPVVDGTADAGMTFLGQFIDHDITFDATSAIGTVIDPRQIRNVRTPNLDLDCVYGDGPEATPHLYAPATETGGNDGYLLFGRADSPLDLARNCKGTALIGDPRNDENIYVSQIQGIFICAHNLLLHEVHANTALGKQVKSLAMAGTTDDAWSHQILPPTNAFQIVRRFMRLHYQHIVINDFLPQMVVQDIIDHCLDSDPFGDDAFLMPVEFSGAAYRFGHATVQEEYRLRSGQAAQSLFAHQGFGPRPPAQDIGMAEFFGAGAQRARPVGTKFAPSINDLPFVHEGFDLSDGTHVLAEHAKILPLRNIIRDRFTLSLPSGQKIADRLGLAELPVHPKLAHSGITRTPLWYYCLEEADAAGGKLDGVGGTIVASVLARLLKKDTQSYVNVDGFVPHSDFSTFASLAQYVEHNRDGHPFRSALWCGPNV